MNRLDFLRLSACSLAFPAVLQGKPVSNAQTPHDTPANGYHYWNKNTRLTIAMWDFSWLTDQGKGGSFENIEQKVEEAAERGYNALRVDCFPSRVLQKSTTFSPDYNPGQGKIIPCWGRATTEFSCNALQKLKQLADACRKHNIWLGLDSWEKGHMMGHKTILVLDNDRSLIPVANEEKALRDFGHTWVKALRLMREEGILERAVWVAPMNEVPHFASRSLESIRQINAQQLNEGEVQLDKNQRMNEIYKLFNLWMGEEIKDEISREGIPLSYSSLGAEEFAKRLPEIYDVVDVHFMPNVITSPADNSEFTEIAQGHPQNFSGWEKMDLKRWSEVWDRACRNNYDKMLIRTRNYLQTTLNNCTFSSGKRLQAVITESFGPCFWPDHPDVSWEWYKYYNGDSARIAAAMPFEGVSLSNYGEPLFSLWKDTDWHRNANLFTLNVFK
ncbi:MAG: hypothetical protein LBN71_06290 [Tannerella sp.]|jgi:hypothetical protein|nr:hypothetical protein [Tannerella sp.]